jgi:predicted porin
MNVRQKLSLAALCTVLPAMASAQAAAVPAAPPAAPKASVTVYGNLNVNLQSTMAKDATDPTKSVDSRWAVSTDSSNVGVKAQAELSFGLTGLAQCETSANVDAISVAGICNRNSRVGLQHEFGTLFYGNWDTPFKTATYGTKIDDPFGNTDVFGYQSLMGSPGFNARSGGWVTAAAGAADAAGPFPAGSSIHGFDTRANNSVAYHSPKLFGASAKLQYSVDEFASADGRLNPTLFSAGVNYEWKGLSVAAAFDRREDAAGLATINKAAATDGTPAAAFAFGATAGNTTTLGSVDWAWKVGAGYEFATPIGTTTVSALIDQLTYAQDDAPANSIAEYKRFAYQVAAKHRYGDHELRVRYNAATEGDCEEADGSTITCDTEDYGATQFTVGYALHLSKAAQAYVSYTKIMNDEKATYTLTIGGAPAVAGATVAGADPQAVGLGIRYAF